jgi:hypothetical protein
VARIQEAARRSGPYQPERVDADAEFDFEADIDPDADFDPDFDFDFDLDFGATISALRDRVCGDAAKGGRVAMPAVTLLAGKFSCTADKDS